MCGNLVSSTLSILVFKESRFSGAIPSLLLVPFASKAAAAVGLPTYVKDTPAVQCRGTQQWRSPISGYGFENRVNELPTRRLPCLGAGDEEVRHRSERHGGVLGARRP